MSQGLPVSRLINVAVNLSPPAASFPNLNTALILGTSDVIDVTTRIRTYGSIDEVAVDFGTSSEEYLAAVLWFEQAPQPVDLKIGRWVDSASNGQLFGGALPAARQAVSYWTGFLDASFRVTVDGGAPQNIDVNLSGISDLNDMASTITAELTGATMTWDSERDRFVITSTSTGATSSVSFLSATGSGTDISDDLNMQSGSSGAYQANGLAAQTALATVALFDDQFGGQWYGLVIPSADNDDHLEVSAYIEAAAQVHYYGVTTQESAVLVTGDTTSIAYLLSQENVDRTGVQYSSDNPYAVVSLLARILTTDWDGNNTTITLMYKQEPGIVAEELSTTQADAAASVNANVFVEYNNDTAIIQYGKSASGEFIDTIIGIDWLRTAIQTNCYNALYTTTKKIPQTDAGMNQLAAQIAAACQQGVANGLLAPGLWTSGGFGQLKSGDFLDKGYYIYQPLVASQAPADRALRKSVPFQVAAKLAGAVHTVDVTVDVNP